MWLGHAYVNDEPGSDGALASIFCMLWFAALVSATMGLLQWLYLTDLFTVYVVQADISDSHRAMGNLGQPNQLATLLLIGIACLTWTYESRRIGGLALAIGVAFMTMVLVFTQSRAGMISGATVAGFLIWKNWNSTFRLRSRYILVWAILFCALTQALPSIHDAMLMGSEPDLLRASNVARHTMWKQTLSGIEQAFWFGYGWNQTPTAHSAGSIAVPGSLTYTYAHNIVLDLLAWNGVPLGFLLTGACFWWFVSRIEGVKNASAIYAMACLLPIAIHSMVEFPFAYSYFLLTAGLMAGIVEASRVSAVNIQLSSRWIASLVSMWFAIGGYMVYEYLLIEEDFRIVRFESLRVGRTPAEYEVPHVWMLSHMASMLNAARQQAQPGMQSGELENLRKSSLRFPYGLLSFRYAVSLGLNGDAAGATRQMAIIRGMFGETYYRQSVRMLREMQAEKYPELSKVSTP